MESNVCISHACQVYLWRVNAARHEISAVFADLHPLRHTIEFQILQFTALPQLTQTFEHICDNPAEVERWVKEKTAAHD
eukprot:8058725-Pyramimonas_sp.AAC.1